MNKSDFVSTVAERVGTTKKDTKDVLDGILETVEDVLVEGEEVNLSPLGKFKSIVRSARKGRNPQTGEDVQIPEKNAVKFSPSSSLKAAVNE